MDRELRVIMILVVTAWVMGIALLIYDFATGRAFRSLTDIVPALSLIVSMVFCYIAAREYLANEGYNLLDVFQSRDPKREAFSERLQVLRAQQKEVAADEKALRDRKRKRKFLITYYFPQELDCPKHTVCYMADSQMSAVIKFRKAYGNNGNILTVHSGKRWWSMKLKREHFQL